MVSIGGLALAVMVVSAVWFVGTGLVAMISHRRRALSIRTLGIAIACGFSGVGLIAVTAQSDAVWATYVSFLGGLFIWSWHEISFLTGAVAGVHRDPCPPGVTGWRRFTLATMALIHHEVALAMTAALLLSLAAVTVNPTGAYAFALLLIFRLSSKFNIFAGVPHLSDDLLPEQLGYLKSYFGPKALHPLLPFSTLIITMIGLWFAAVAIAAPNLRVLAEAGLLGGLTLLAALEHLFLILPFRDSALWGWATGTRTNQI